MAKPKGKLIVIEGSDGAGKSTQIELLISRLKKSGRKVYKIHFPNYKSYYGQQIKKLAHKSTGYFRKLDPHYTAVLYALDRYKLSDKIRSEIKKGNIVVCDRYASAGFAYQAAQNKVGKARNDFRKWHIDFEYNHLQIPKPNMVFYLYVPLIKSAALIKKYRKQDGVESDKKYLKEVEKEMLNLTKMQKWQKVNCLKKNELMPISEIHELIWQKVKRYI
ncbi:MAG: dTMP kinase [bacterium]